MKFYAWGMASISGELNVYSGEIEQVIWARPAALEGYRTPMSIEVWLELPRGAVGKVLKREIRARFWAVREHAIQGLSESL